MTPDKERAVLERAAKVCKSMYSAGFELHHAVAKQCAAAIRALPLTQTPEETASSLGTPVSAAAPAKSILNHPACNYNIDGWCHDSKCMRDGKCKIDSDVEAMVADCKAASYARRADTPKIEGTDEAWDEGRLGNDARYVRVATPEQEAEVEKALGTPNPVVEMTTTPRYGYQELIAAVENILAESEEFDFDDGMGRGAQQTYWDELSQIIEHIRDSFPEKQAWKDALDECIADPAHRARVNALYPPDTPAALTHDCPTPESCQCKEPTERRDTPTPRTTYAANFTDAYLSDAMVVLADFARQLERELAATKHEADLYAKKLTKAERHRMNAEENFAAANAENARLMELLGRARFYAHDAGDDEDPDAQRLSQELVAAIDASRRTEK